MGIAHPIFNEADSRIYNNLTLIVGLEPLISPMGYSVTVDSNNFQSEVVETSYSKPVLIDFAATWCGPCQVLKPILEKLVTEYDFVLAKIDIDENPDLASDFSVEGVPDVRIVNQGKMIPGFVGVLPEAEIRELISNLGLQSSLEQDLEQLEEAIDTGNVEQAKQLLDTLFTKYPDAPQVAIAAGRFLVTIGQFDHADQILATIPPSDRTFYPMAQEIKALIMFEQEAGNPGESELDQQFAQACRLVLQEDHETALKIFLELVATNRKYKNDGARKAMLAIFNLLGEQHPLTQTYQQELMMTLY